MDSNAKKLDGDIIELGAVSGSRMDRQVKRKFPLWKRYGIFIVIPFVLLSVYFLTKVGAGHGLRVDENNITISIVSESVFEYFIPVRGVVTPLNTVYLDAVEGGRVESILVEDGALVNQGDLLVKLSNASLQLDVIYNEAAIIGQLNNIRSTELQIADNRLQHTQDLMEINYEISKLSRVVDRETKLAVNQSISKAQLVDHQEDLAFFVKKKEIEIERQQTNFALQQSQLEFSRLSSERLENNLSLSNKNLESLNIRAQVDGKLSGFSLQIGQNIPRGERMGQIDNPSEYKLRAKIDEFYLDRVELEQVASLEKDKKLYELKVVKIYPQVKNGQFEVDFKFNKQKLEGISRGQTLQAKLILGDAAKAVVIPNGAFYSDTGGNWVFVVGQNGKDAHKRKVRLGRTNPQYIEVLEGLSVGEKVVTSTYANYIDIDRLKLNQN